MCTVDGVRMVQRGEEAGHSSTMDIPIGVHGTVRTYGCCKRVSLLCHVESSWEKRIGHMTSHENAIFSASRLRGERSYVRINASGSWKRDS